MKQKRLIILTLLLSGVCIASSAQGRIETAKTLRSSFGLKAGLSLSNISNGEAGIHFAPAMKAGFHLGVVANLHFGYRDEGAPAGTGWFGVQPELIYSQQGFAVDGQAVGFDFLTLPLMAKLYVTKNLSVEAGPSFSYLLGVSPETTVIDDAQIALGGLKSKAGVGAGVGLEYETRTGLILGARYNLGLTDMANNLKWKNNAVFVSAGWLF